MGTIATFVFVGYMFDYYLRIEEAQLVRKKIYYDSILMKEHIELKESDSILKHLMNYENAKLNNRVNTHHTEIKKIFVELDSLDKK
jgi:hypothetical protein